jgi:hypothetical protein
MGFLSDNMANATNQTIERMKAQRRAKDQAIRDAELRVRARGSTTNMEMPRFPT